jgi:hypothetical protein
MQALVITPATAIRATPILRSNGCVVKGVQARLVNNKVEPGRHTREHDRLDASVGYANAWARRRPGAISARAEALAVTTNRPEKSETENPWAERTVVIPVA